MSEDRFVIRWPCNGEINPDNKRSGDLGPAWLEDLENPGQAVYSDGGEPEDMILCRDLRPLVDELNDLAVEITRLRAELVSKEMLSNDAVLRDSYFRSGVIVMHAQSDASLEGRYADAFKSDLNSWNAYKESGGGLPPRMVASNLTRAEADHWVRFGKLP